MINGNRNCSSGKQKTSAANVYELNLNSLTIIDESINSMSNW